MDPLLVLVVVIVASFFLVSLLMGGISWSLHWVANRYSIGRQSSHFQQSEAPSGNSSDNSDQSHISIPILEAQAKKPTDRSDIASTCLIIMPNSVTDHCHDYALAVVINNSSEDGDQCVQNAYPNETKVTQIAS